MKKKTLSFVVLRLLRSVSLFSFLIWLYVVAVSIPHPEWLPMPVTHWNFPPFNLRTDDLGIISFLTFAATHTIVQVYDWVR